MLQSRLYIVSLLHIEIEADHSLTPSLLRNFLWSQSCVTTALQTSALQTADEKKQGRSVCIREEDRAESVAIKDGRVRLNFNTTRQSFIRAKHTEVKQRRESWVGGLKVHKGRKAVKKSRRESTLGVRVCRLSGCSTPSVFLTTAVTFSPAFLI